MKKGKGAHRGWSRGKKENNQDMGTFTVCPKVMWIGKSRNRNHRSPSVNSTSYWVAWQLTVNKRKSILKLGSGQSRNNTIQLAINAGGASSAFI